jgi:hypothetical protein
MKVQHDSLRHAAALKYVNPFHKKASEKAIQVQGHKVGIMTNLKVVCSKPHEQV